MNGRESFGSRLGFILVSAGCAIGLGNVWKFPYMTGANGGAAFILIYLAFLLILGVPIMTAEFAVGRGSGQSAIRSFAVLQPRGTNWGKFGPVALIGNYGLMSFYTMVTGWMLVYAYKFGSGQLAGLSPEGVANDFGALTSSPGTMLIWNIIAILVCFGVCALGLKGGVERISKVMMTLLLVLMIVMAVRSVSLSGAGEGLKYYLIPNWGAVIKNGVFNVCFAAMSQAFFTLSIGIGSMAIFGSYLSKDRSLFGEALSITGVDTFVALMAGFIVIPACFAYHVQPDAGPSLLFITLPNIFNEMTGGRIWGLMFFIFMSFAALSTVIAVFENIIACWMDLWGLKRKTAVLLNLGIVTALSIPCILGFSLWSGVHPFGPESGIMDLEDFIVSNNLLPLGSLIYVMFCSYRYGWGWESFRREVNSGKGLRFPMPQLYMQVILPAIIILIYVKGCLDFFAGQGISLRSGIIFVVIVLALVAYVIFVRKRGTKPNGAAGTL